MAQSETDSAVFSPYMQNRELSWLEFNKRVLDQGADPTVPLLERLNFISIFWSNLQEFFMVRVGSLTDLSLVKKSIIDSKSGMTPSQQLDAIYARCHELYGYYEQTYEDLRALLHEENIDQLRPEDLTEEQREFVLQYLDNNVIPFLSPQIINARHPFPHLENGALYIVVRLDEQASKAAKSDSKAEGKGDGKSGKGDKDKSGKQGKNSKNLGAEDATLGLIPLPRQCERLIILPDKGLRFILLEHALEMVASNIFSMYRVKHTNVICVTRNADLDATEGTDEQDEDYREHMKRILKKRSRLAPVRLESERELSSTIKPLLLKRLGLKEHQSYVTAVPLDMSYTWGLSSLLPEKKRAMLVNVPFSPQWPATLDRNRRIIDQVAEHEVLLSYPYESMDAFVQLLREAAVDPQVISIKITLYRLASQSHLAEALIAAAEAGKEVTALFELRARFDESNNIEWSQRFEQAGCKVIYGFRNFKVHSKICSITRRTPEGLQHITQLGTGNYNEKTARLYTDFSFITTNPAIGRDAVEFFRNMALENVSDNYDILWVAPLQIKAMIMSHIDEQIARAKAGEPAALFFKTNSVTDKELIEKIVEASQAGVRTTLFVRGICCLVPGQEGFTDQVRVVSIVGRLLEHSRIYCFGPRDNCRIYLSSADLMTRNMDKRIEIAWPILNESLKQEVIHYLDTCLADTAKLRELLPDKEYTPLGFFAPQAEDGSEDLFNAQQFLIEEAQRKHLEAVEQIALRDANRPFTTAFYSLASADSSAPQARPMTSAQMSLTSEEELEFIENEVAQRAAEQELAASAAAAEAEAAQGSRPRADAVSRAEIVMKADVAAPSETTPAKANQAPAPSAPSPEPSAAATSEAQTTQIPLAEAETAEKTKQPTAELPIIQPAEASPEVSREEQPQAEAPISEPQITATPTAPKQVAPAAPPSPPKKRGFFARLFGHGK